MQTKQAVPTNSTAEKIPFETYLTRYNSIEGFRSEWIAGEVAIYPVSNNTQHQDILRFLTVLLDLYLGARSMGRFFLAGVPMYLGDDRPAREPDLLVILSEHLERIKATYLDGIADIVVEIVSPDSDERDHGAKFVEYEAAGVPEYWLIDPLRSEATIYVLGVDRRYHRFAPDEANRFSSSILPGFSFPADVLWKQVLPSGSDLIALVQQMK